MAHEKDSALHLVEGPRLQMMMVSHMPRQWKFLTKVG